jgi:hypothetical protein
VNVDVTEVVSRESKQIGHALKASVANNADVVAHVGQVVQALERPQSGVVQQHEVSQHTLDALQTRQRFEHCRVSQNQIIAELRGLDSLVSESDKLVNIDHARRTVGGTLCKEPRQIVTDIVGKGRH